MFSEERQKTTSDSKIDTIPGRNTHFMSMLLSSQLTGKTERRKKMEARLAQDPLSFPSDQQAPSCSCAHLTRLDISSNSASDLQATFIGVLLIASMFSQTRLDLPAAEMRCACVCVCVWTGEVVGSFLLQKNCEIAGRQGSHRELDSPP